MLEENTKSTPPLLFQQSLPYPHATPLRLLQPQPLLGLSKPTQQPPHCLLAFAASDIDLNPHRISRFQHSRSLYRSRRTQLRAFGFTRKLAVAVASNTTSVSLVASTAVIILLQVPSASSAITSCEAISNAAISTQRRPASYSTPSFIISPHSNLSHLRHLSYLGGTLSNNHFLRFVLCVDLKLPKPSSFLNGLRLIPHRQPPV